MQLDIHTARQIYVYVIYICVCKNYVNIKKSWIFYIENIIRCENYEPNFFFAKSSAGRVGIVVTKHQIVVFHE